MTQDRRPMDARFKDYEEGYKDYLEPNNPTIIRLDGCSFSKFTKGLVDYDVYNPSTKAPFSDTFSHIMQATANYVMQQTQNAVLAYTQSDEISLLLRDWDHERTEQWFNGNVQKITSVSSALCTAKFNHLFKRYFGYYWPDAVATFDSRVFQVPIDEVTNYFIYRQGDAFRNAVNQIGRHYMSHKQMHGMPNNQVVETLLQDYNVDVHTYEDFHKYGTLIQRFPDRTYHWSNEIFKQNKLIVESLLLRK